MIFHRLKRAWRRRRSERRRIRTGWVYHNDCWEIVVSKKELLIQLGECDRQDNLLKLLVFGKDQPDYEKLLLLASLKFEFLGSLVYPINETKTKKPTVKFYIHKLFEGFYETLDEVREHMERLTGHAVSDEEAHRVFRKLLFVIYTCCPCMADTSEIWWTNTYRCFLEYAVEHEEFSYPACDTAVTIWDAMPKDIPRYGCKRHYVLDHIPPELREREIHAEWSDCIRW